MERYLWRASRSVVQRGGPLLFVDEEMLPPFPPLSYSLHPTLQVGVSAWWPSNSLVLLFPVIMSWRTHVHTKSYVEHINFQTLPDKMALNNSVVKRKPMSETVKYGQYSMPVLDTDFALLSKREVGRQTGEAEFYY